jgi:hypothetical protein
MKEVFLSRVINPDNVGKERTRLSKCVVLATRELVKQPELGDQARDLAAFISLALGRIFETVDVTVGPWEKRDYWVKADKFRNEWAWAEFYSRHMKQAVLNEDWENITKISMRTAQKLCKITVSPGHHLGQPWVGAWNELRK